MTEDQTASQGAEAAAKKDTVLEGGLGGACALGYQHAVGDRALSIEGTVGAIGFTAV
jgi:hypothetical protein